MRAYLPGYELKKPATLAEALGLLATAPGEWRPFAGGTDLMVLLEAGKLPHTRYVSLWGLKTLAGSRWTADGGILVTARTHRTREANREEARRRLAELVAQARIRPERRIKTKPSKAAKAKRVEAKARTGAIKRGRARPALD